MSPDADHVVIARSLREPEAFRVLFDRHFAAIHRYLRHRCGEQADDLAAETFVRAFAARGRYVATHDDARPWLYAIATNLMRDEARRASRGAGALRRLGATRPAAVAEAVEPADVPDPELTAAL
ncbi:MAG TPA: sigma factor, partial [Baekduia sp.]